MMEDEIFNKDDRDRIQDSLVILRSVAGWNAEQFASKIGVTRQYYSELENHSRELTQSLYLAVLYILEKESNNNNDLNNILSAIKNKGLTIEQCKSLSNYIASERKRNTSELNANRTVFAIIGATATALVGIIVKAIVKK